MTGARQIRVLFFGTPDFAVPTLKALLSDSRCQVALAVAQPDKPAGRGGKMASPSIKLLAADHGIPVLQPASIRKAMDEFMRACEAYGPFDVGVVVAFGQILPPQVLRIPKSGCINIHASLLPRWRGAAPIQCAIMAGDPETGVCLMQMDAGLDTGPVLARVTVGISESDDAGDLHDKLAEAGAKVLIDNLAAIADGLLTPVPQPAEGVTYAEKITVEEGRIDWSHTASFISRKVRALAPSPGAYTFIHGKRLKVFKALAKTATNGRGHPGSIAYLDDRTLDVFSGDGIVSLLQMQIEGKRRMDAPEFLRGYRISNSDRFD